MWKVSLKKKSGCSILLIDGEILDIHPFPVNGIRPELNVIAWQDFELAYYKVTVQHFGH